MVSWVVDVGAGLVEAGAGEGGPQVLEWGEAAGGLEGDVGVADVVVAFDAVDVVVEAPPFAGEGAHAVAFFAGEDEGEGPDAGELGGFGVEVGEGALDVVHHLLGLAEDGVVDALEGVLVAGAVGFLGGDEVGVVDVAAAEGLGVEGGAFDGEVVEDLGDFAVHVLRSPTCVR